MPTWILTLIAACAVRSSPSAPPAAGAGSPATASPGADGAAPDSVIAAKGCEAGDPTARGAEEVWTGDLKEPEQLRTFCDGYCSRSLHGSLILHRVSNRQVARLTCLREVSGDVKVLSNFSLTHLKGLDGLRAIGGDLLLEDNVALTSLSGLESLERIGGRFDNSHSIRLQNLDGLRSLRSVGGDLTIFGGWKVEHLDGLGALQSVGGSLRVGDMRVLSSLRGLGGLSTVDNLFLQGRSDLRSLDGLSGLKEVRGFVSIEGHAQLCERDAEAFFERMTSPPKHVGLRDNAGPCPASPVP